MSLLLDFFLEEEETLVEIFFNRFGLIEEA
jgi:hypothetical protein